MNEKIMRIKPCQLAMISAGVCGLVTHVFGLVNVLHNYDDIAQQPRGYGTGVTSGRWLLSLFGDLANGLRLDYNLTTVNGLLFLMLLACSAGLLVAVLQIDDRRMAMLTGMLFTAFPTVFATLVFRYTCVYYGFGVLLSVCAVWVLPKYKFGPIISALCVACSLGIYQAYVPITITVFVLMVLQRALREHAGVRDLIAQGVLYCGVLLLGLLFYYGLLNVVLRLYGTQLSDYQGVNEMGAISLKDLPALLYEAVYSVFMLPLKDYCGVAATWTIKSVYTILAGFSALLLAVLLLREKRPIQVNLLIILLCGLIPLCVNFIVVMCPQGWIYTIMVYSFVLLAWVPVILWEGLPVRDGAGKRFRDFTGKILSVVLAALVFLYSYQSNVNYMALHYANRQVEHYLGSLVTQIRMTEGFSTDLEWVFIGEIDDPLLNAYWQYEVNIGGYDFTQWLLRRYSVGSWIQNYYGYDPPMASEERAMEMAQNSVVREMPCWPNDGSIQIIDDVLVVKFEPRLEAGQD